MAELELAKVILNAGTMGILLVVLVGGYHLLTSLINKLDKLTEAITAVGGKVETVGRVQDERLDLLEERVLGRAPKSRVSTRGTTPSWPGQNT